MNNISYRILLPIGVSMFASCSSTPDYDAQGTFEATEVIVSSEGNGKILYLDIDQGDSVVAGRTVGEVDTVQIFFQRTEVPRQYAALDASGPNLAAQIASLREQIAGTLTDRDRVARLLKDGAATQQQLDNLNTKLASLQGQLDAQRSTVNNSRSSIDEQMNALVVKSQAVDDQIARCVIASPISGVVLDKLAEAGEVTSFGKPLFKVADMHNIYLRAYFTSDQLSALRLGQKVTVVADYGAGNEKSYEGTVSYLATQSEFTPKTIQTKDSRANLVYAVKIAVKNDGLLKIGLTGNVYVGNNGN